MMQEKHLVQCLDQQLLITAITAATSPSTKAEAVAELE